MKTKKILLAVFLVTVPFLGFAQEWDDIYADPNRDHGESVKVRRERRYDEPQRKKRVVVVQGDASHMEVMANGRNVDEYNRRGNDGRQGVSPDTIVRSDDYEAYEYTDRIVRFHDPESSIKITGADEVIVYMDDDLYDNYNHYGCNHNYYGMGWGFSYYPWYDSWYYPWYSYWYNPWYYGSWYSPWYYSSWYSPWYYRSWYSPWYHGWGWGGWYDSWFYGGYYGYYGGYYDGFYDGYYSSMKYNRSGRSSGVYRSSNANRTSTSYGQYAGRASRGGTSRSAYSGDRYTTSGNRSVSSVAARRFSEGSRTRILDNSGRSFDSRTGRAVSPYRSGTGSESIGRSSGSQSSMRSHSYGRGNSSSRDYNHYSSPSRSNSSYQSRTTPERSIFSTPSRSSRSGSYDSGRSYSPSRSSSSSSSRSSSSFGSSSGRSSSGSFGSSSGRSSSGGSSGRSSGGRR